MKLKAYYYEVPLFFFILFAINQAFTPEIPAFIGVSPHPFWAGVLLFGFRYGVSAGLVSGVFSAIIYLSSNFLFGELYLFEDLSFYLLPSLFIIIGTLVGLGVERYLKKIGFLTTENQIHQENDKRLRQEIQTQTLINQGLEKKISTRMATLVTLYEGARKLESLHAEEIYEGLLDFFAKALGATKLALYLKEGDSWHIKKSFGWSPDDSWPQSYSWQQGLVGQCGSSGKTVSIRDFSSDSKKLEQASKDGLSAGPLKKDVTGEVIGVVAIQSMPLAAFNSATVNMFSFLLNWASRSLGRALYFDELKSQEILDPELQIYSFTYFQTRFHQELLRSRTYYLPLGVLLIHVKGLQQLSPHEQQGILLSVSEVLHQSCRQMDIIAKYPEKEIPFSILMTTASEKQCQEIKDSIESNFKRLNFDTISLFVGMANFSPKTENTEDLIATARENIMTKASPEMSHGI